METLCLYQESWINEVVDEETGEVLDPSHYGKHLITIQLQDVIKMKLGYNSITIMTVDGEITDYKDIVEIYYR